MRNDGVNFSVGSRSFIGFSASAIVDLEIVGGELPGERFIGDILEQRAQWFRISFWKFYQIWKDEHLRY